MNVQMCKYADAKITMYQCKVIFYRCTKLHINKKSPLVKNKMAFL